MQKGSPDFEFPDTRTISAKYDIYVEGDEISPDPLSPEVKRQALLESIEHSTALVGQNEDLIRHIERKNKEIETMHILLEACEPVPGLNAEKFRTLLQSGDENCDYRDSKIVALAKKVRRLTVAINKERATAEVQSANYSDLSDKYDQLQKELEAVLAAGPRATSNRSSRSGVTRIGGDSSLEKVSGNQIDTSNLQRELTTAQKSLEEMKRKQAQSVDEIKNLTRALHRELGEGVSVEQAVDGGWRGRAQQIVMLKAKIKKLEAAAASGVVQGPQHARPKTDVDSKAEEDLAYMSSERKQAIEMITEERGRLAEQCQVLETKQKSLKARIRTLENDGAKYKQQMQLLIDKTGTDDQLIEALREENARLSNALKQKASSSGAPSPPKQSILSRQGIDEQTAAEVSKNLQELQRLRRLCKQQAEQLNTQDDIIRQLRAGKVSMFGDES